MPNTLLMSIIIRPAFPEKKEILMEAKVDDSIPSETLAKILFDMEVVLNEHLPQMRFHTALTHKPSTQEELDKLHPIDPRD